MTGPLCSDLCRQTNVRFGKCLSTIPEKKVYEGEWKGKQVIIKMNMDWFKVFVELQKLTDDSVLATYQNEVAARVKTLFGDCSECSNLTSHLLLLVDSNSDSLVTTSEARTFISLLHHLEPMMLIVLNESKHSVDFYGYCGGLYFLEKVPFIASQVFGEKWELQDFSLLPDVFEPLEEIVRNLAAEIVNAAFSMPYICTILSDVLTSTKYLIFNAFYQTYVPSVSEKFDFVYSLLDATLNISSNPYGMLQSCDVHLGNFGVTNDSIVKVIDFDQTYPKLFLSTLLKQKQCSSDDDCWVGTAEDCHSSCVTKSGTCASVLWKQDLINICETHIPFIFRAPSNLLHREKNSTCLKEAIRRLVVFCQELPVIESIQQLRQNVLAVKEKLQYIESNSSHMC